VKWFELFERLGWQVARQKASHIIMVKPGEIVTLSVPDHKEVPAERFEASFAKQT
jgi:predicted RNA binding protein YcfA (HicA-like mRNA interferase family)